MRLSYCFQTSSGINLCGTLNKYYRACQVSRFSTKKSRTAGSQLKTKLLSTQRERQKKQLEQSRPRLLKLRSRLKAESGSWQDVFTQFKTPQTVGNFARNEVPSDNLRREKVHKQLDEAKQILKNVGQGSLVEQRSLVDNFNRPHNYLRYVSTACGYDPSHPTIFTTLLMHVRHI